MAVTKLLRIKETSGRSKAAHLKNNIQYICKNEKTDSGKWIGGNAGTTPEQILKTMKRNKRFWSKESGSQAFHYMLSFPPGENVSEELAMQITREFCEELLGDEYFHAIAVHNDKEHIHSHITFDSVNRLTGRKFHSPKGDWKKRIQPITDRLCKKYNLPTLKYDPENRKGKNYTAWENEKAGNREDGSNKNEKAGNREDGSNKNKYAWYDIIRDDIDEAIEKTDTWEGFLEYLKKQGYKIRLGKYLSLKPYGKEKAVRSHQLGYGYGKEDIMERIRGKKTEAGPRQGTKTYGDWIYIQRIFKTKKSVNREWKLSPFQKQFYRKWNFTYFIRKPRYPEAWKYKKDILRVEKLAEQLSYVIDHDINSYEDIELRKEVLLKRKKEIQVQKYAGVTKLKKQTLFIQAAEYIRAKKELAKFPEGTRQDLEEKICQLEAELGQSVPISQALSSYNEAKERVSWYDAELKNIKNEFLILQRLVDVDLEVPEMTHNKPKFPGQEKDTLNQEGGNRTGTPNRITINEKLFATHFEDAETYTTRVPYSKQYVRFDKGSCQLQNDGTILSVYIYDEKEYLLSDAAGENERRISGKDLKSHYEDKTRKSQKGKGARWE